MQHKPLQHPFASVEAVAANLLHRCHREHGDVRQTRPAPRVDQRLEPGVAQGRRHAFAARATMSIIPSHPPSTSATTPAARSMALLSTPAPTRRQMPPPRSTWSIRAAISAWRNTRQRTTTWEAATAAATATFPISPAMESACLIPSAAAIHRTAMAVGCASGAASAGAQWQDLHVDC